MKDYVHKVSQISYRQTKQKENMVRRFENRCFMLDTILRRKLNYLHNSFNSIDHNYPTENFSYWEMGDGLNLKWNKINLENFKK